MSPVKKETAAADKDPMATDGIEFIEFATYDEADTEALVATFEALGFVMAARHRSKEVALFSQGDINLIVDRESESYAKSFAITHGMSVCAMAFRVDDAQASHAHALELGATEYTEKIGPGELRIPALRGLLGTLIYLVDVFGSRGTIYDTDFQRLPGIPPQVPGLGLTRVDHVSLSVLHGWTEEWVQYFARFFGFRERDRNRITDPRGGVLSTVVADPGGNIHICINEPLTPNTNIDLFIKRNFGSGVQHIAFETGDIFESLGAMEERGLEVLAIPSEYYDGLEKEGKLEPSLIDRLRRHNVMIDSEGGGRLLHVWTRSVKRRFFFEIVQREGHTGFGRGNVNIRLKALQADYSAGEGT